jgi:hypothetical protein
MKPLKGLREYPSRYSLHLLLKVLSLHETLDISDIVAEMCRIRTKLEVINKTCD